MLTNPSSPFQPIGPGVMQPPLTSATPTFVNPAVPPMLSRAVTPAPMVAQPGNFAQPGMLPGALPPPDPSLQLWKLKFPSLASGILSSVQALVAIVIIGCEVGSILIDMFTATIYVGLWAGLFFMIAWICQAASGKFLLLVIESMKFFSSFS